ncbi:hypothetical protein [Alteromonas sp. H39]|uniref:hypothetical protein n=1 Tax=Alteromonas sp. H39 TaxID=3389876 RepID=UPI0039E0F8BC
MSGYVAAIAIVAIIGWVIVEITNAGRKKRSDMSDKEKAEMQKEIANLKSRIEVLEKIVIDEKYDLKKQFKDLENDKVA